MVWKIEIDEAARRSLAKMDRQTSRRILKFLHDRVLNLSNPRSKIYKKP